jgi:hypothetical protein
MSNPKRDISSGRKALYYAGLGLVVIGLLLFASVFVSAIVEFGRPASFFGAEQQGSSMMARAFGGIALVILGSVLMSVGSRGAAGSGLVLDPRRAREDLEPWGRAAGGLLGDALDEAGVNVDRDRQGRELTFDEKLRRLDQLRKENLITEDEYQAKRREILDQRW